jgi:hypothetical protein
MVAPLFFLLRLLVSPFRSISRLEAENAALRRQLIVLRRQVRGRVQFTNSDRLFFLQLYRWFPSIVKAMTREETCRDLRVQGTASRLPARPRRRTKKARVPVSDDGNARKRGSCERSGYVCALRMRAGHLDDFYHADIILHADRNRPIFIRAIRFRVIRSVPMPLGHEPHFILDLQCGRQIKSPDA